MSDSSMFISSQPATAVVENKLVKTGSINYKICLMLSLIILLHQNSVTCTLPRITRQRSRWGYQR